jgi:amino acid transporter
MATDPVPKSREPAKFGTFGGVFTPNVLTILGVIMFLRTGWVVGNAGLKQALLILCIANAITLLTSLSLSAIATNIRVKGGGAYFLISRNLGLEIGGAIGFPLFLAQAVSVAFYIIGFIESLRFLMPDLPAREVGLAVLVTLLVISWVGASLAVKTQYLIMGALLLSLISFFAGWTPVPNFEARLEPGFVEGHDFWTVFAIFFPAVTGIMSGVSMSGDLREPSRSIPRGTIVAVLVTWAVYALQMVWLAWNADRTELVENTLVMQRIALSGTLIFVGLWAATLSSALASLLAAPRTLQALANDGVMPRWLGRGSGPAKEPKIALLVTAVLAGLCLLIGKLDLIAPIISMFFLTAYGTVNLVAGLSRLVSNPSYRPTFRVHWLPCLIGAAGCVAVMFLLNALATVAAVIVIFGIYALLKRRQYKTAWGDERSGLWFSIARFGLLKLGTSQRHVRNWRPVILVLVGNVKHRMWLVDIANRLEARRGLLFLAQILSGDWQKHLPLQASRQKALEEFIAENRLSAVGKTVLADDFEHGVSTLLQVLGVGALEPNTVLIGWSEDVLKREQFAGAVSRIMELKRNLMIHAEPELPEQDLDPVIDVWWRAKINGGFMLTLAHLLREGTGGRYREQPIRVRRIIKDAAGLEDARAGLQALVDGMRIDAEVEIVVSDGEPLKIIGERSARSEMVFVGIALDGVQKDHRPLSPYEPLVEDLKGNILLCKNWHDMHPGD